MRWEYIEGVVRELTTNFEYTENVSEILTIYFEQNPKAFKEWLDWFDGKQIT